MRRRFAIGVLGLLAPSACLVTVDESLIDGKTVSEPEAGAGTEAGQADTAPGMDRACVGLALGNYCGRGLELYKGNAQDLVRCFGDGGMGTVTPCSAGCVAMPTGRRDICNPCVGAPAGSYCVNQIVSDYNMNDVRISCSGNMVTTSGVAAPKICPKGCGDAGSFGDCL